MQIVAIFKKVCTQWIDRTLSLPNIKPLFLDRSARCLIESQLGSCLSPILEKIYRSLNYVDS